MKPTYGVTEARLAECKTGQRMIPPFLSLPASLSGRWATYCRYRLHPTQPLVSKPVAQRGTNFLFFMLETDWLATRQDRLFARR